MSLIQLKMKKLVVIKLEFGSGFQEELYAGMFKMFLEVMKTKMEGGHKKNKVSWDIIEE